MEKVKYRLLIADDEYWTREKIRTMINWEEYPITFMKPAEDGEEVLQRMETEQADILITDINMPFVNGVDLVRRVRERWPETVVFVISGYDDFHYVKDTLLAGAINYLLKPVSKIELVHAISRALEIIGQQEADRQQIIKAASLIQDRELSLLVEKRHVPYMPVMMPGDEEGMAGCSVMLVKIHELQSYMEDCHYDMNLLSCHIKCRIKEITGLENLLIFNHIYRSNEFVIVTELDQTRQKKAALRILEHFRGDGKSPVTIGISEHTYTMESIHGACVQSVSVLMTRPFSRDSMVIFCNEEETSIRKTVQSRISQEAEMQIRALLKSGNSRALKELTLEGIGLAHCAEQGWDYLEVKQTVKRISNLLLDDILQKGLPEQIQEMENLAEMADKVVDRLDGRLLADILTELIDSAMIQLRQEPGGTIRDIIRAAVAYIDENYFEELTLVMLADRYGVESSYFSRMFKQETGRNLMMYIAEKRVGKAREYMEDKNINLTEIAFLTGCDDYTYFSRVFKKITGKSPREYRGDL